MEIPGPYDVGQLYADGQLVADSFYYGAPWRVPASLLYGKECFLALSELAAISTASFDKYPWDPPRAPGIFSFLPEKRAPRRILCYTYP